MIYNGTEYNGTEYKGTVGDVLTSGGFGCIFEPTLQCELKEQYKNTNINKKGLSKLMIIPEMFFLLPQVHLNTIQK